MHASELGKSHFVKTGWCVCVCVCVTRMGCGALDYRQQSQQMELRTGGMSVSTQVIQDSTQLDMYEQVSASSQTTHWIIYSVTSI